MTFLQHWLNALREANDITIKAPQDDFVAFVRHANYIYSPYGTGLRTYRIKEGDDFLFVGDGHVKTLQLRVGSQNLRQIINAGNFEVDVLSIDVLVLKALIEIPD